MSRIGKKPISVPSGVTVNIAGHQVRVKGPKGELVRSFPDKIEISLEDGNLTVSRGDDARESRALHGLSRALLANMVQGVTEGYRKELSIVGVGYRALLKGRDLELQVGYSHTVQVPAPSGIDFEVPEPGKVIVSGINNEQVGQVAADIRQVRPPEPYKGKGIRYANEYVRRKAGKAGKR
jgi:large subunit ribosomal protein L6